MLVTNSTSVNLLLSSSLTTQRERAVGAWWWGQEISGECVLKVFCREAILGCGFKRPTPPSLCPQLLLAVLSKIISILI